MDTLMENQFLHKLNTYLHFAEHRQQLEDKCLKVDVIMIPKKISRKTTSIVCKLKKKAFVSSKTLCMTVLDVGSLDTYENDEYIFYKLPQRLTYLCSSSTTASRC